MDLKQITERLAQPPGILCAAAMIPSDDVDDSGTQAYSTAFAGDDQIPTTAQLYETMRLRELVSRSIDDGFRIILGGHTTIVVLSFPDDDLLVAVAMTTGHPIAKSLNRMVRRVVDRARKSAKAAA